MALTKNLGTLGSGNAYSHSVFLPLPLQKSEVINTGYRIVVLLSSTHKISFDLDIEGQLLRRRLFLFVEPKD